MMGHNLIRAFIALELSPQIKDELAQIEAELKTARADVKWVRPEAIHITLKFLGNINIDTPSPFPLPKEERGGFLLPSPPTCPPKPWRRRKGERLPCALRMARVRGVENIKSILDRIASRHTKFELSLFQIGGFPKLEYPRVIWVGIDKGCSQAEALAKDVEEELNRNSLSSYELDSLSSYELDSLSPQSGERLPYAERMAWVRGEGEGGKKWTAHITLGRVKSPKGIKDLVAKIKALDFKPSASCIIGKITLFQSTLTPHGSIYIPLHEAHLI